MMVHSVGHQCTFFPCTVSEYKVIKGEAVINCRFILLPLAGHYAADKEFIVEYGVKL